jgi:hypothetical protein
MQISQLLANHHTACSTKCLADVAQRTNSCNYGIWVALPVAAFQVNERILIPLLCDVDAYGMHSF